MFRQAWIGLLFTCLTGPALAQGEDGTPAQRHAQIITEMLAGHYDNANQAYFDKRLKMADGKAHGRMSVTIEKAGDGFIAVIQQGGDTAKMRLTLAADDRVQAVRAKRSVSGKDAPGCDLLITLEPGQFRGRPEKGDCALKPDIEEIMLSEDALWIDLASDGKAAYQLEKARDFSCYADVPGVGGGRDIPYKRYQMPDMHDKGGDTTITLKDKSEVTVRIQNIRWPMNNMKDSFTRHSLVMYVMRKEKDEKEGKEVGYTWTEPTAQRIGMNLKWMLVNCTMIPGTDVTPFFKSEPRL